MPKLEMTKNNSLCHYGIFGMHWGVRRFQNKDGSLTPEGRRHYYGSEMTRNEKLKMLKERRTVDDATKKQRLIAKGSRDAIYKNRHLFTDEEFESAMGRAEKFEKAKQMLDSEKLEANRRAIAEQEASFKDSIMRSGNPKLVLKNAYLFSDDELNQAYNRLQKISSIEGLANSDKLKMVNAPQSVNKGRPIVDQLIDSTNKTDQLIKNAGNLALDTYSNYNKTASIINAVSNSNKKLPVFSLEPWDSLKPKNKKISKDAFKDVLNDAGILSSLSGDQVDDLYKNITGG